MQLVHSLQRTVTRAADPNLAPAQPQPAHTLAHIRARTTASLPRSRADPLLVGATLLGCKRSARPRTNHGSRYSPPTPPSYGFAAVHSPALARVADVRSASLGFGCISGSRSLGGAPGYPQRLAAPRSDACSSRAAKGFRSERRVACPRISRPWPATERARLVQLSAQLCLELRTIAVHDALRRTVGAAV